MESGLCWYKKGTNNKWTYDLTNNLMVDLETIITLAFMTYILDLDAYEFHPRDEKIFNNLLMNARVLYYTYDWSSFLFKDVFLYLC
jgi:hypothetical protein